MTITPRNQPHIPPLHIDLDEILGTLALELARVQTCDQCQQYSVPSLINDLAHLVSEISRLHTALIDERLISANLRAAIRAALGADRDGEADPLSYLRDEITPNTGGAHGA
jgi:hypothetical protein